MTTIYKAQIIKRWCSWYGVDGNHYEKNRFIEVIFYTLKDVENNRYFLSDNFGTGLTIEELPNRINRYSIEEPLVTIEMIKTEIEKVRQLILKDNSNFLIDFGNDY